MKRATLYIFSGLPGVGKSTLAQRLAREINAGYLRIDTIEQGLRDLCNMANLEGEGYRLAYLIAKDHLVLGTSVIADSVNPWELTRREWMEVATSLEADFVNIEVICSDMHKHRMRVENRDVGIKNFQLPTWEQVISRDYHAWTMPRIIIDTATKSIEASHQELLLQLGIR